MQTSSSRFAAGAPARRAPLSRAGVGMKLPLRAS